MNDLLIRESYLAYLCVRLVPINHGNRDAWDMEVMEQRLNSLVERLAKYAEVSYVVFNIGQH